MYILINDFGYQLATFINSLDVENKWKKKHYIDWYTGLQSNDVYTGLQSNKTILNSFHSHCSSYVASICKRLNVPMYGPEFNIPTEGLANKQYQWLFEHGHSYGWINIDKQSQLENEIFAQLIANNGYLVIVCHYHLITPFSLKNGTVI